VQPAVASFAIKKKGRHKLRRRLESDGEEGRRKEKSVGESIREVKSSRTLGE
jgi:hypothetical protein